MRLLVTNATCVSLEASITNINSVTFDGVPVSPKSIPDNYTTYIYLFEDHEGECVLPFKCSFAVVANAQKVLIKSIKIEAAYFH